MSQVRCALASIKDGPSAAKLPAKKIRAAMPLVLPFVAVPPALFRDCPPMIADGAVSLRDAGNQ
ncbi:MAG: hypothetical protein KGQ47_06770 [Hyphomicrobiales bacterium]|nr:hypothetical protein [Hyphomicrobiales bacterium]